MGRLVNYRGEKEVILKPLEELFPFDYEGGGYFRQKGVAKYVKAEVLHGMEAIKYLYERIANERTA